MADFPQSMEELSDDDQVKEMAALIEAIILSKGCGRAAAFIGAMGMSHGLKGQEVTHFCMGAGHILDLVVRDRNAAGRLARMDNEEMVRSLNEPGSPDISDNCSRLIPRLVWEVL